MEEVYLFGAMGENTKGIIQTIFQMDRVYFFGLMDMFLMGNGKMDCNMVKE